MPDLEVTQFLDLVNARHGPGADLYEPLGMAGWHDHLAAPATLAAYLDHAAVAHPPGDPTEAELQELRDLVDLGRALADGDRKRADRDLPGVIDRYRYRLTTDGAIVPDASGWTAWAAEAARGLVALVQQPERLRTCANPDCRWLFVDESRNHSRVWCSMESCGSRAKMSRYRSRKRHETPLPAG